MACGTNITNHHTFFLLLSGEYISTDPPRVVLNKMDQIGYKVVASTGVGQTIIWTLYKPEETTTEEKMQDRSGNNFCNR